MRLALHAAAAATLLLIVTPPAQGQSLLKRLGDRALNKVEEKAVKAVEGEAEAPQDSSPAPATASPADADKKPIKYISQIAPPTDFDAVEDAYDAFGKVDCNDCEGGHAYEGWVSFPRDEFSSMYEGKAKRIGSWPVGHIHNWQGRETSGTLTVVAEEAVEGFRCRRLLYRLTRGDATAERPGLVCWGYANEYSGSENWNEAY